MLPQGFLAAALAAGIKPSGKPDLSAVVSDRPCQWAFAGTRSAAAAACVERARVLYASGAPLQGLLVNAGNANAATGEAGQQDNAQMAARAAQVFRTQAALLTASTGVIGHRLPMERVEAGLAQLPAHWQTAALAHAEAIMTTDTYPKLFDRTLSTGQRLVGVAKGSGMIHPDMATMFSFVYTDAAVDEEALRSAFGGIVARTFNAVTVDGDTSTNDMTAVLCNGAAGEAEMSEFLVALEALMRDLAREIARDGEGATTLLTIRVSGAASELEALQAARTCAGSALLKSAVNGRDPNWGRIIAALGRSGAQLNMNKLTVAVQGTPVFAGLPLVYDEAAVSQSMRAPEVIVDLGLGTGTAQGEAWGCDLSAEYVRINADYTT